AAPDLAQLLSINCIVLGDDPKEGFTVEIAKNKNVSVLKDLIKEKKKPHFDNVAASKLILSQVSLPMDDNFEERIKNTHQLNSLASLAQLFPHVERDHIHIVVQGPARDVIRAFEPTQLLSLNCFVLGDDQDQMFTVKILKTDNVSILRDLIKEKKNPHLNHVAASELILSQVSLPVDNDLEANLKNLDLTPLKPLLPLLSQVFPRSEEDCLHVVVKVPGEPDMTHPAEKAHHQIIKDANAAAAPSSVSNSPAMFKPSHHNISHSFTTKLSLASTPIYKTEKERTSNVYPYICSLLGIQLRENVAMTTDGKKKVESDGLVEQDLDDKTFGEKVAIVGHVEAKNELGVAGQSGVQNMLGLRSSLMTRSAAHTTMWMSKTEWCLSQYNDIRNTTCCPCIVISIAGPYIMFSGAIFADIFVAEAFTDYIYLGGTKEQIVTLSRIFAAVAPAFNGYAQRILSLSKAKPRPTQREPAISSANLYRQWAPTRDANNLTPIQ
ncbi:hypothetical protein APHAL10511_008622, partial [Amanita phalloides]